MKVCIDAHYLSTVLISKLNTFALLQQGFFFNIVTYDLLTLLPSLNSHWRSFSCWLKIEQQHNKYFQAEKQFVYCLFFCQYEFLQNGRLTVKDWTVFKIDQICLLDSATSSERCVGLSAPSSRSEGEKSFLFFFAASHASSALRAVWPTLLQHSILCRLKGKQTSLYICGSLRVKFSCVNLISLSQTQFYTCACIFFIIFSSLCLTFDICLHGVRVQGRWSENFT